MRGNQPVYRSFLIRFWHEKEIQEGTLRAIVVDTQTGEKYAFNSSNALVQFLKGKIDRHETQSQSKEETIEGDK